jgi:hypothetical protein
MALESKPTSLENIRQKLQPSMIRSNLVRAGLFLTGWELLKAEIQDKVHGIFSAGVDETGLTYSTEY